MQGSRQSRGLAFALLCLAVPYLWAAKIEVDGAGLIRDRELRLALNRLLEVGERTTIDANAIEDAAVIISSALSEAGFQQPEIEIIAQRPGAPAERFHFDPTFAAPLPRPLEAERVRFEIQPGRRSYIADVTFTGLTAIPDKMARAYFLTENTLLMKERTNPFSRSRMTRANDTLLGELRNRGYASAEVQTAVAREVDGAVVLAVEVLEGTRWLVGDVIYQRDDQTIALPSASGWMGKPWSPNLEQEVREAVRHAYYAAGFPDVGVHVAAEPGPPAGDGLSTDVVVTIVPGSAVRVGEVRFAGNDVTRGSVLRRRIHTRPGDPLNPIALDRARYRISRLGVFEAVDLRFEPTDGAVRDVVYVLRESPRYETSLLFGYGSYEQLRGGIEYRQMNIMGLAHQSRLELVHSLKSTSGEYTYSVPELFGESLDGSAKLFGLQREEVAFVRQEFGLSLTLRRPLRALGGETMAGYTFQSLRNRRNALATEATDERHLNVASLMFGLTGDRRDNPLRPRHGYHWSGQIEAAAPMLGGEATYQRTEFAGAYHTSWGAGRWVHLALSHGFITTSGAADDRTLPVNKRFFPGGDNSIRGFQRGEAAPRGADGRFVGAKTYVLGNVELEQALTPSWSIVAFFDALGSAESWRDYPFAEKLYSAGLGIRYQTLIGPVRLEYGRNINRRPNDPSGTWHFSIGYPF